MNLILFTMCNLIYRVKKIYAKGFNSSQDYKLKISLIVYFSHVGNIFEINM